MYQLTLPTIPQPTPQPTTTMPEPTTPKPSQAKAPRPTTPADLFSAEERYSLRLLINTVKDSMRWNAESEQYEDDGSFILTLDKEEMAAITRALKKI